MNMKQIVERIDETSCSGAELTNRLIPGDEDYEYPEWSEEACLTDGTRVRIYYRTTPEDKETAIEHDWGTIDWSQRITRIVDRLDDGTDGRTLA